MALKSIHPAAVHNLPHFKQYANHLASMAVATYQQLRALCFYLCFCTSLSFAQHLHAEDSRRLSINFINGDSKSEYTLTTAELRQDQEVTSWQQRSPVYPTPMHYDVIALAPVLAKLLPEKDRIHAIKFHCEDGFTAKWQGTPDLSQLLIALNEHGKAGFSDVSEGKLSLNPGPYYVITAKPADYQTWPWPSQVYRIDVHLQPLAPRYYPVGAETDSQVMAGYQAFSQYCIGCHSINLEGGQIGPELNIPQNITEYQNRAFLRAFIRNASSFRAKSRMMTFSFLADQEIESILDYLTYMRKHKDLEQLNNE